MTKTIDKPKMLLKKQLALLSAHIVVEPSTRRPEKDIYLFVRNKAKRISSRQAEDELLIIAY